MVALSQIFHLFQIEFILASLQDGDNTVEDEITKANLLNNICRDQTLLDELGAQTLQNNMNDISPVLDHITITTS